MKFRGVKPQIALPEPCSYELAYTRRVLPEYIAAIEKSGGEAVLINPRMSLEELVFQIKSCSAVLLPSCQQDVDPERYNEKRHEKTAQSDPLREALDELLLQDAYHLYKPIFGICYGQQSLNVWRGGKLDQCVHERHQKEHDVTVLAVNSLLYQAVGKTVIQVNSKHRQAVSKEEKEIGEGLRVTARAAADGKIDDQVVEALEGDDPTKHYVLALQWHPERDFDQNPDSRNIFGSFIEAARG